MANVMGRPESPVYKTLENQPVYALETIPGVLPAAPTWVPVDKTTRGRAYLQPNVRETRTVGGRISRVPGIIRAGVESLEMDVQAHDFLQLALRVGAGTAWHPNDFCPSFSMMAGSSVDAVKLWGCVIDSLELSQSYSEDSEPLKASASIMALGGALINSGYAYAAIGGASANPLYGWQSAGNATITTGSYTPDNSADAYKGQAGYRVREWKIGLKNNHKLQTYGDRSGQDRGGIASNPNASIREAYMLQPGEEEIDFEAQIEMPAMWNDEQNDNFAAACYTPGVLGFSVHYFPCSAGNTTALTLILTNLVAADDYGFEYEYDATGANGDPVHVYSLKARKYDPLSAALSIGTATVGI